MTAPPVDALLPHRGPALLIEEPLEWDETRITCAARIRRSSPFASGEGAPAFLAIEMGAQCAACLEGLARSSAGVEDARASGYVVSVRESHFTADTLPVDVRLFVTAETIEAAPPLRTYRIEVREGARLAATAVVSTFAS